MKSEKFFPDSKRERMAYNLFYSATFLLVTKYISEQTWLWAVGLAFGVYLANRAYTDARTTGNKAEQGQAGTVEEPKTR